MEKKIFISGEYNPTPKLIPNNKELFKAIFSIIVVGLIIRFFI